MKQLSRIALCLPLLMLNIEHAPDTNSHAQLSQPTENFSSGWGWRLKLNTADASQQCEGFGGDMQTCYRPPGGGWDWDWGWPEPCDWYCGDNSDGGDGGGGSYTPPPNPTPPNDYRPISYERCIADAGNDKEHCLYLAGSVAVLTSGLCAGFTFPPAVAACVAVATAGGLWEARNCGIRYNEHVYECSTLFASNGGGSGGGQCGPYGCTAIP